MFKEVRGDRDDVIMSVHCHNDLGLAVANSLASLAAGARQIEGAINGIGERAGNTSIEEVVMAIKTRQDVLRGRSRGRHHPALRHLPAGGPAHRLSGAVQQGGGRAQRLCPRVRHPSARGAAGQGDLRDHGCRRTSGQQAAQIVLGKHSGRAGFLDALNKMGITLEDEAFTRAFERFKQLADRKIQIGEEEVRAIVEDQTGETTEKVKLVGLHVAGGNEVTPTATVRVMKDGVGRASPVRATEWCTPLSPPCGWRSEPRRG